MRVEPLVIAMRRYLPAVVAMSATLAASGCGGAHGNAGRTPTQTRATAPPTNSASGDGAARRPGVATSVPTTEVLAIAGLGRFFGSCPDRGPFSLALNLNAIEASDDVSYRIGTQTERQRQVDPGGTLRIALPATRLRLRGGDAVLATPTLRLRIQQPREPETILLRARLRLAQSRDGSRRCLMIGTNVRTRVYFSDGGPPR